MQGLDQIRGLDDKPFLRLAVAGIGFMPIAALALALGGLAQLHVVTLAALIPVWAALAVVAAFRPPWGKVLALVLISGMAATAVYDVARLTLSYAGGLTDGIPNIGRLLLGDMNAPTGEVFGLAYAYRYLGDGGGLAIAYAMGRRYGVRSGMAFGASICLCLWATLAIFPVAQQLLFPLSAYGLFVTMTGHLIFGGVLGGLMARLFPAEEKAVPTITLTVTEAVAPPAVRTEAAI